MMHRLPARRVDVVLERLLQMNQPALTRAVNPVLERGESDNIVCRVCHSLKQTLDELIPREAVMRGYASQNDGKRTQPERVVIGNGDVMLAMRGAGQPHMTARLACDAVSQTLKAFDQVRPRQIARQSHAASTSSRVMCRRIRPGNFPSSK